MHLSACMHAGRRDALQVKHPFALCAQVIGRSDNRLVVVVGTGLPRACPHEHRNHRQAPGLEWCASTDQETEGQHHHLSCNRNQNNPKEKRKKLTRKCRRPSQNADGAICTLQSRDLNCNRAFALKSSDWPRPLAGNMNSVLLSHRGVRLCLPSANIDKIHDFHGPRRHSTHPKFSKSPKSPLAARDFVRYNRLLYPAWGQQGPGLWGQTWA